MLAWRRPCPTLVGPGAGAPMLPCSVMTIVSSGICWVPVRFVWNLARLVMLALVGVARTGQSVMHGPCEQCRVSEGDRLKQGKG